MCKEEVAEVAQVNYSASRARVQTGKQATATHLYPNNLVMDGSDEGGGFTPYEAMQEMWKQAIEEMEAIKTSMKNEMQAERSMMQEEMQAERIKMQEEMQAERTKMQEEMRAEKARFQADLEAEFAELQVRFNNQQRTSDGGTQARAEREEYEQA